MTEVRPYNLERKFESFIVASACTVPKFWGRIQETIEIEAMTLEASRDALSAVRDIAKERGTGPNTSVMVLQRLRAWMIEGDISIDRIHAVAELLEDADDYGLPSHEDVLAELVPVLKGREVQAVAMDVATESAKPPSQVDMGHVLKRIRQVERLGEQDKSIGHKIGVASLERIKALAHLDRLPLGIPELDTVLDGGMGYGLGCLIMATGVGKCHAKGQEVLAYDGRLVKVEDVQSGDLLMGPDSTSRRVLNTVQGSDDMYEICPHKGGDPWRVNIDHVLTLQGTGSKQTRGTRWGGQVVDVSLREWLGWSAQRKHNFKLVHAEVVDFHQDPVLPIDPYFLGVLLGDGSIYADVRVTTADVEIEAMCHVEAERFGLRVHPYVHKRCPSYALTMPPGSGPGSNKLINALRGLKMYGCKSHDKFIPHAYKIASVQHRRELLAGLIDTDGCVAGSERAGFDYVSKSLALAQGVAFVARSLGIMVSVTETIKRDQNGTEGMYHRVGIHGGGCAEIPVRLERKRPQVRTINKNSRLTGFTVESVGVGAYYGFNLDGDSRYLLDDFTITHNSMAMCHVAAHALMSTLHVGYATLELPSEEIEARIVANLTGIPINVLMAGQAEALAEQRLRAMQPFMGALVVQDFTPKVATVTDIIDWIEECEAEAGVPMHLGIVDMLPKLKDFSTANAKYAVGTYQTVGNTFEYYRNYMKDRRKWGLTAMQPQRGAKDKKKIDTDDAADSMEGPRVCDTVITGMRTEDETQHEFFVAKARHSEARKMVGPLPHDHKLGRMVPFARRIGNQTW